MLFRSHSRKLVILGILLEIIIVLALILVIGWDRGIGDWFKAQNRPLVKELSLDGINSSSAVLITAKGGKIIGEENAREILYPASLTKMMTAILGLEELRDLEQTITLTSEMFDGLAEQDATQAGFLPGETVTLRDLLYGTLLPSGAECCRALAFTACGSEEEFVELMNEKAARIGLENTHFCNTTGLHDDEHYSTVYDMAVLLKYCLNSKTFREIMESPYYSTKGTNLHPDGITFYSTMLKHLPDPYVSGGKIMGGKTGYTDAAGLCLASFADIQGRDYILVSAGAPAGTGEPLHVQDAVTIYERLGEAALALE